MTGVVGALLLVVVPHQGWGVWRDPAHGLVSLTGSWWLDWRVGQETHVGSGGDSTATEPRPGQAVERPAGGGLHGGAPAIPEPSSSPSTTLQVSTPGDSSTQTERDKVRNAIVANRSVF